MLSGPIELPIAVAAERLGISPEALRKRLTRRTVRGHKRGRQGDVVMDGASGQSSGRSDAASGQHPDTNGQQDLADQRLVDQLRNENAWLRRRLEEAETAQAEMRRLVLAHTPALSTPSTPQEPPAAPRRRSWRPSWLWLWRWPQREPSR